jgi:hypothetical protein
VGDPQGAGIRDGLKNTNLFARDLLSKSMIARPIFIPRNKEERITLAGGDRVIFPGKQSEVIKV